MTTILDISHHQVPSKINYDTLAKQVDFVIVRTQYGSNLIDRHYKTHHKEFQKRGVPTGAYAWLRGVSVSDMEKEATDFYNRTKEFNPAFWFLDVEEKSMSNMRKGTSAFLKKLRSLGAKNVGIYVGHHLYKSFNLDLSEADAVWIPHYGKNNGTINSKPDYKCDIHQYTDKGKLKGYSGYLDLNRILGDKPLSYFTGGVDAPKPPKKDKPKPSKPKTNTAKSKWTEVTGNWTGQTLKKGQYGKPVKQLQTKLSNNNPPFYPEKGAKNNGVDGYYGDNTVDAVKRYQSYVGLVQDGIAGKKTYASLVGSKPKPKPKPSKKYPLPSGVLKHGSKGEKVKQLQRALNAAYFKVGKVDGIYGNKTEDAVRRFQMVHDAYHVDGIYGPRTRSRLNKVVN